MMNLSDKYNNNRVAPYIVWLSIASFICKYVKKSILHLPLAYKCINMLFVIMFLGFTHFVQGQSLNLILWPKGVPGSIKAEGYGSGVMGPCGGYTCIQRIGNPEILVYLPTEETNNHFAVLICPGGGYGSVAAVHEGTDVALWLATHGIAGIVLKYRLPSDLIMKDKRVGPLQDAQEALRTIRRNAAQWNINPHKIGVMGFSAGGHLASTLCTHYSKKVYDITDTTSARPDFSILVYPVISMDSALTHMGSRENLIGRTPSKADVAEYSNDLQINKSTPAAFLVHSADDNVVPVQNSILYFQGLQKYKIPAELHVYEKGGHGYGLANAGGTESAWKAACLTWLKNR